MGKIINFIKHFFCRHKFLCQREFYVDEDVTYTSDVWETERHYYRQYVCTKCGKTKTKKIITEGYTNSPSETPKELISYEKLNEIKEDIIELQKFANENDDFDSINGYYKFTSIINLVSNSVYKIGFDINKFKYNPNIRNEDLFWEYFRKYIDLHQKDIILTIAEMMRGKLIENKQIIDDKIKELNDEKNKLKKIL